MEAERRQVTVLFADMVGFTSFAERSGEEAAFALMRSLWKLMTEAVREHGGVAIETANVIAIVRILPAAAGLVPGIKTIITMLSITTASIVAAHWFRPKSGTRCLASKPMLRSRCRRPLRVTSQ
jgi:class 3 adenylate cyclase